MPEVTIHAGICGFITVIRTSSTDMQTVTIDFQTTCPNAARAREDIKSVDAYAELFKKPHETSVYAALSKHLPHAACPLYCGFLKAIEAAAGLGAARGRFDHIPTGLKLRGYAPTAYRFSST